jgi:metal-responsive CopG/Arc/MetJ family transcriptional regulator
MANGVSATESVSISFQTSVLRRLDAYCEKSKFNLNRSQVTNEAVKQFLATAMAADPSFWEAVYDKYEKESKL